MAIRILSRVPRSRRNARADNREPRDELSSRLAELGSRDLHTRRRARRALMAMGNRAVPGLAQTLENGSQWARWEAAKALGQIGTPDTIRPLVSALGDPDVDVCWVAVDGLAPMRSAVLEELLRQLVARGDSQDFREGAHHVLHELLGGRNGPIVRPVFEALNDPDPGVTAPLAAQEALRKLSTRRLATSAKAAPPQPT
jgi:HEAT repeat protein